MKIEIVTSLEDNNHNTTKEKIYFPNFLLKKLMNEEKYNSYNIFNGYGNNQKQKEDDQEYLIFLYKNEIKILAECLNKLHKVNYSVKYWERLIGSWFIRFIFFLYNRHKTIDLIKAKNIEKNLIFRITSDKNDAYLVPNNIEDFYEKIKESYWNDLVLKKILIIKFPKEDLLLEKFDYIPPKNYKTNFKFKLKDLVFKFIDKINFYSLKKNKYFIYRTFLGTKDNFLLNHSLGQVGNFNEKLSIPNNKNNSLNKFERLKLKKFLKINKIDDEFLFLLRNMISNNIPKAFVEHYVENKKYVKNICFPENPEKIFTTIAYDSDLLFKFWFSEKLNSKIIIGQHGSNYQTKKVHIGKFERLIFDKILVWGNSKGSKQDIPSFNFKTSYKKKNVKKKGNSKKFKIILKSLGQQIETWDRYYEFYNYMNDKKKLIKNLDKEKLIFDIRLSHTSYKKYVYDFKYFSTFLSRERIDKAKESIYKCVDDYELFIFTYDSSGFLEFLSLDIPVILYQKDIMEEINDEAKIVYKKMINANLIFTDENKLASFLKDNIVKIDEWWSSSSVKLAKIDFNFNFSLPKSKKHLKDLSIIIKNQ